MLRTILTLKQFCKGNPSLLQTLSDLIGCHEPPVVAYIKPQLLQRWLVSVHEETAKLFQEQHYKINGHLRRKSKLTTSKDVVEVFLIDISEAQDLPSDYLYLLKKEECQ